MDPQGQLGKVLGVDIRAPARSAIDLLLDSVLGDPGLDRGTRPARAAATGIAAADGEHAHPQGLDVIVANKSLGAVPALAGGEETDPDGAAGARARLGARGRRLRVRLFDAPPSFGPLTLNVLRAADEIVVPVPLTFLALDGCAELMRTVETVRTRYGNPELRISMVVPTFYRRTNLAHEILEKLKQRFPKEIAHTVVGYHVRIDEAQSRGLSIFEHAPTDRGARVLAELAEELELRGIRPQRVTAA